MSRGIKTDPTFTDCFDPVPPEWEEEAEAQIYKPRRVKMPTFTVKSTWWIPASYKRMRNPPIWVLRRWWVSALGKTNRSFKRTSFSSLRYFWRKHCYDPSARDVFDANISIGRVIEDNFIKEIQELEDEAIFQALGVSSELLLGPADYSTTSTALQVTGAVARKDDE